MASSPANGAGWYDIGGTSLSSPEWAGLVAIADQINGGGLGLINPGLYRIGADPTRYAADFHDVTIGNNQTDPTPLGVLTDLERSLAQRGAALLLAEVKGPVLDRLQGTDLGQRLEGRIFLSTHAAFEYARRAGSMVGRYGDPAAAI